MELRVEDIQKIIPQRYPVLFLDRVTKYENDEIIAVKNVSINEPFFVGHFADSPVLPGIVIVEAMAQAAIILFYKNQNLKEKSNTRFMYYLSGIKTRFIKTVKPGDRLEFIALPIKIIKDAGIVNVTVRCGSEDMAKGEISFKVVSNEQ